MSDPNDSNGEGPGAPERRRRVAARLTGRDCRLTNGLLDVVVDGSEGRVVSIKFRGLQLLAPRSRVRKANGGYWTIKASGESLLGRVHGRVAVEETSTSCSVTVPMKYTRGGADEVLDVELLFRLESDSPVVYAAARLTHLAAYSDLDLVIGRFALKLAPDLFDYLAIDDQRRTQMPSVAEWQGAVRTRLAEARRITSGMSQGKVEHKYAYAACLFERAAYGWAARSHGLGVWLLNPSGEYISGGPTKVELTGHLDVGTGWPVLLNVWHGSHFGGSKAVIRKGEYWEKEIGPFAIYCNAGESAVKMFDDACARGQRERETWPYRWNAFHGSVGIDDRIEVSGRIQVGRRIAEKKEGMVMVGLTPSDYPAADPLLNAGIIDWQLDGRHYQYWAEVRADGSFRLKGVRPGEYTLRAFAEGIMGEYSKPGICVRRGSVCDLGDIVWTPHHWGNVLWTIGTPDRTARGYKNSDKHWLTHAYERYYVDFPNGVNFRVGRSVESKDWHYVQPPSMEGGSIGPTSWHILFDANAALRGQLVLRVAIAGARLPKGAGIGVLLNGKAVGTTGPLLDSGVMHRDGIRGYWCERAVQFPADLLRTGENRITLVMPGTKWHHGVLYDCIQLEHF